MSTNFPKPTYEELLKIVNDQELEINRLLKKEESATSLEFYFKESLDLVCLAGTDGFFKEINPAFVKILGYTKQELLSIPYISLVHPEDVEKSNAELKQLGKGISSLHFENRFLKKNGENVCIQWTTSVHSSKEIIYAIGRDVTKIKKAEADLLESEELLENAQKISKIGSWEYNYLDHKMIWSNELYSIYELERKDNQDLFQEYINRFSKSDVALFSQKIKQCKIDKRPFEVEGYAIISEDKTKWVHAVVYPIVNESGDVISLRGNTQDITEKKLASEELNARKHSETELKLKLVEEESNHKFRNYIENAPDGIFIADENGNFIEVNQAISLMSGYSKEELLTFSMTDLTYQESLDDLAVCFNRLKVVGGSKGEFKTIHKSGEIRWSRVDSVKLSETRFMGFVKDITELKQANELLSNTFERITDAFVALDNNWCYSYMNKKAGEIFGFKPEEMIGKHIWTVFPEGIDKPFYNAYYQAVKDQKYLYLEEYYEPYDLWFENHIYPSSDGLSIFFRDITEEKTAETAIENNEKYFRALVENNEAIITVLDENSKTIFRSPASQRITGYTNEEFTKIFDIDYYHPDYVEYMQENIQKTRDNPGMQNPVLFQVKHKNGNYIWLEGVLKNLVIDSSLKGIVANLRDVTESKKSQTILTNTFDRITDAFVALDTNFCYTYMNKKAGEILDRDPVEMIGKHIWTEFPDSINGAFYNACHKSVATQQYSHFEDYHQKSQRWVENHIYPSEDGISNFFRDITEEKLVNDKIEQSEKRFRALVENNDGIITVVDDKLKAIFRSVSSSRVTGYTDEEFDKILDSEYFHPDYLEYIQQKRQEVLNNPRKPVPILFQVKHKNGNYIWLEGVLNNRLDDNSVNGIIVNLKDVTERKKAKDLVQEREKRFYALIENADSIISLVDKDKKSLFRSSSSERLTGWTDEEFDTLSEEEFFHPDCFEYIQQLKQKLFVSPGELIPVLFQVKCKNGNYVWLEGNVKNMFHDKNLNGLISNLRDVTERKLANELLINERDKFAKIAATSPGLIYSMRQNLDGSLSCPYASESIEGIYGFSHEDIENNQDKILSLIHPEDVEDVAKKINATMSELVPLKGVYRYRHPSKGLVWHEVNSLPVVEPEGTVICHGIITDITDRIIAEKKLNKVNRLYLFISQINQMIVRATEEESLFRDACNIAVEVGEFKMAWIALLSENSEKLSPIMIAGEDSEYVDIVKSISLKDVVDGSGPGALVFKEEKYVICNDIENDVLMKKWRNEALACGYHSLMALPIKKFGKLVGIFTFYSAEKNFFDNQEIALLEEATGDVGFALEVFDRELQRQKAEDAVFQSEKRYHTLTEVSPVGIFRTDATGYTTYVNPSWTEISGLCYEKALGNGWLDAVHPEDRKSILNGWENATIKNEKSLSEYRFIHPDGKVSWVMGQAIPEKDENNVIIGYVGTVTDITERKNQEEEINKANKRFEMISLATNDAIFELDFIGGKCWHNKVFYDNLNYYNEHLTIEENKLIWRSKLHPDDRERIINSIDECYASTASTWTEEFRFQRENGSYGNFYERAIVLRDELGNAIGFIGSMQDITNLKKAEENYRTTNKKLEGILNALPDLLFEVGLNGHIYNYHSHYDDLLVMPASEFIGKNFSEIMPKNVAKVCLDAIKEAAEFGFSNTVQYSLDLPEGVNWFELSIARMAENEEKETHFICLSRDITDAKKGDEALLKSEERYRGLLDNLDAGIVVHAADTSVIMSNNKASELLGLSSEQILGKKAIDPIWKYLNDDNSIIDIEKHPISLILKTKEAVKNFTLGINHPNGDKIVWVLVNGFPVINQSNEITEIVISFIDITERKLMEIEITEGRKQAESANKAKTDFLANMSHEIRTPLNGIIGFTHLLMKSNLEKNQSEYMSTINESATSLLEIVNDVLDFSKIESGKLELNIEELDLFKLTHQAIDLFKYQAEQKNIDLVLNLDKEVPQFILADSVRLKQILVNLLSNAIKFTNTGTIRLDIDALPNSNRKSSKIKFSVKDTGIGIKGSNNAKIFQSFVQEDNSTNRKFGGTGLGLAISNQLLALMNSKLNLVSEYGEGSDFFFEIDFKKLKLDKKLAAKTEGLIDGDAITALQIIGRKKVLIVEDNRINMLLAKTLVKRLVSDCIIYEARDGNEAVEKYKEEMPDIILMDIQMPNKNGYEATLEIRQLKDAAEIPIIAITAGIMADDKEKCLEAGLNDYLSKPIIESDLEKMLFKWLDK